MLMQRFESGSVLYKIVLYFGSTSSIGKGGTAVEDSWIGRWFEFEWRIRFEDGYEGDFFFFFFVDVYLRQVAIVDNQNKI